MGNRELGHFFIEEILENPSSMRTRIILLQPEVTRDRGPDRVSLKHPAESAISLSTSIRISLTPTSIFKD